MVPAGNIAVENKAGSIFQKLNTSSLVIQVYPAFLFFVVKFGFASGNGIYIVNDEVVLITVHPLNQQRTSIRFPIRQTKLLIIFFIKSSPHNIAAFRLNNANLY